MSGMSLHKKLEEHSGLLIFGILAVSAVGGLVQILPILFQESLETPVGATAPYSAVALTGRDIYIREGCSVCHTQQIRPLIAEVERYGPYSRSGEFVYDRPFLWGSKRTGPDLHRIGGKYSDIWHREHLLNPRSVVPDSIMPGYPWLAETPAADVGDIQKKMRVLQSLGHPYSDASIEEAESELEGLTEMDALIVYLQQLGTAMPQGELP
ncbi:cbb3-type cytochrome c oxidase subunit II [Pseudohongiella nitratireducens]|uniref:Cbb3-type cytochrome c oxidase subunit II n=2 Tax=Pseudohongiella nitratireducens TaxID=1768907 RepID=A0A916QKL7_9GAMM|nr:cbb3-type cytochrome c oxidase subunit II [Pseudohongiella nitratireducens]|tara:strand:- start:6848 stop:7477 length:630 start_codon:yes stop_codon:yes gene_type:complete